MNYETTERTMDTVRGDVLGQGGPAVAASETTERVLSGEPANSNIRTALLAFAGASVLASLFFQITGKKNEALFIGQWPPTLVAVALWYQIVKSERGGPASQQA